MRGNGAERGHPRLSRLSDNSYRCAVLDDFLSIHRLMLEGVTAYIIGPRGYIETVTVSYPLPHSFSYPYRKKQIIVSLTEFWLDWSDDKTQVHPFSVYDVHGLKPVAQNKIDH